jgi:hypothetical protein
MRREILHCRSWVASPFGVIPLTRSRANIVPWGPADGRGLPWRQRGRQIVVFGTYTPPTEREQLQLQHISRGGVGEASKSLRRPAVPLIVFAVRRTDDGPAGRRPTGRASSSEPCSSCLLQPLRVFQLPSLGRAGSLSASATARSASTRGARGVGQGLTRPFARRVDGRRDGGRSPSDRRRRGP